MLRSFLRAGALVCALAISSISFAQQPLAAEAGYGFAKMQENWADAASFTRTKLFRDALESYKLNAIVNRSLGKPIPEAPKVPILVAVDVQKAKLRYMESLESGLPIVYDFYIETPLQVAPDAFDLDPKPIAAPDNPVGAEDGEPCRFLVVAGSTNKAGDLVNHAECGTLKFTVRYTPFGAVKRWVKQ